MFWRLLVAATILIGLVGIASRDASHAQFNGCGAGLCSPSAGSSVGPGTCSQASAFLARTSGLSVAQTYETNSLICRGVAHGWWTKCDAYWNGATNTSTTANLNWVSPSFTLTTALGPTFTANVGWTGNGTNSFLNTNYNLSTAGGNYTLNSGSLSIYVENSRAANGNYSMGATDNTNFAFAITNFTGGNALGEINGTGTNASGAVASSNNSITVSRTASNLTTIYKNGSSIGTTASASAALVNLNMYLLALNSVGTQIFSNSDTTMSAAICGGFTSTDAANYDADNNAYAAAFGINNH